MFVILVCTCFLRNSAKEKERGRKRKVEEKAKKGKKSRWQGKKKGDKVKGMRSICLWLVVCGALVVRADVRGMTGTCKRSKRRKSEVRKYDGSVKQVNMETEGFRWRSGASLIDLRPVLLWVRRPHLKRLETWAWGMVFSLCPCLGKTHRPNKEMILPRFD